MTAAAILFYLTAAIAVVATSLALTRANAVHALLHLVVSFLATAVLFALLGASFAAALEVVVYAGAVLVFFLLVVMLLGVGPRSADEERAWLGGRIWVAPAVLATLLLAVLVVAIAGGSASPSGEVEAVDPKAVGAALWGPYALGVELAGLLLLAGLVAAFHLARPEKKP